MEKINWSAVYAIVIRHIYTWKRDLDRVVDSFWWAVMDIIFWGLTSQYIKGFSKAPDVIIVFIGGIIFWTIVQNSQREINMPILEEAWNRNLINLFATPINLAEFIIATLILGLIKLLGTMLVMVAVAFFLYRYNIFFYGWYLLPAVASLILTGWWVGFLIDGFILRFGYKIQAFAWAFIFIIYPFSAVIYPVSILPVWAQVFAKMLPTSYVFENMRSVLFNGYFDTQTILVSFALNMVYLILSLITLKVFFKAGLRDGRLIKLN